MKRLLVILALSSSAFASQAIQLTGGQTGTAISANVSAFIASQSWRMELRLWNWTATTAYYFMNNPQTGAYSIRQVASANTILFTSSVDSSEACTVNMSGRTDVIIRFQRDYPNSRLTCEIWNIQGGNYVLTTQAIPSPSPADIHGQQNWGDTGTHINLAYFRFFSTVVALTGVPPNPNTAGGDLFDYEFAGSGADTNTGSHAPANITFGGGGTYATNPTYGPVSILTAVPTTVRVGSPFTLDGSASYSLNGTPTVTYLWNQQSFTPYLNTVSGAVAPPAPDPFGDNQTAASIVVTAPLAGTYHLILQITDTSGNFSSQTFLVGAVATDSNNIVIVPDPLLSQLVGPLSMFGTSPWPWIDNVQYQEALAIIANLPSSPPFVHTVSGSPGSVAVLNCAATSGGCAITGTSTAFQTDFACNGTDAIVIYYNLPNGKTGARPYFVKSCSSQTGMVIVQGRDAYVSTNGGYDASGTQSGLAYDKFDLTAEIQWITGNNINYYDGSGLGLYRTYLRTGIDTFLHAARAFEANWWIFPWDGGRATNNSLYTPGGPTREASAFGLMAYALDGRPALWLDSTASGAPGGSESGIKALIDYFYAVNHALLNAPYDPADMVDSREIGYTVRYLAEYVYLYDAATGGNTYYSTYLRPLVLGSNSLNSRYHSGYGFTSNNNVSNTFAWGNDTLFGYIGPNYQGSLWLNPFLFEGLIAFWQTSPAPLDQAAALTLLQNSFDPWYAAHYMNGSYPGNTPNACREITYASNYASGDSGNDIANCSNGCPAGSVTATNSSTSIVGSGTNWKSSSTIFKNDGSDYISLDWGSTSFPKTQFQALHISTGNIIDDTHITLDIPFTGTTNSGLSFGRALTAANGVGSSHLPQNTFTTLDAGFISCVAQGYGMGGRTLGEIVHAINGFLYVNAPSGNAAYKTQGDDLFSAAFGCGTSSAGCAGGAAANITGGGPGADAGSGNFADILVSGWSFGNGYIKEFGTNVGVGQADSYLAYRLGGVAPLTTRTVYVGYVPAPGSTHVSMTTVQPDGASVAVTCSSSPCAVVVDLRQGSHLVSIKHLSGIGAIVASTSQFLVVPAI